jgi:hypothetical protein
VQGTEVFGHLLAAGGFNLGGASSAAATPAFGQAPPSSPGFGFGATGVCQTVLAPCCLALHYERRAASHEPTALKACCLLLQVQHHHLLLEPPSQLLAMPLDSQQLKAKLLLPLFLDRWQPRNQHLHLAHLAWVSVLASHRQQQHQVVASALGSRQLLAHLALALDLAKHKLPVHHHPFKLLGQAHRSLHPVRFSCSCTASPWRPICSHPCVITASKLLIDQSFKLCNYW